MHYAPTKLAQARTALSMNPYLSAKLTGQARANAAGYGALQADIVPHFLESGRPRPGSALSHSTNDPVRK
jgi:hypothetical protein